MEQKIVNIRYFPGLCVGTPDPGTKAWLPGAWWGVPSTGHLEGGRKHAGREPRARGRWSGWQTSCLLSLEISSQEHELCQHWGLKPSQPLFGELSFPALPQTKGAFADLFTGDGRHLPHRSRVACFLF